MKFKCSGVLLLLTTIVTGLFYGHIKEAEGELRYAAVLYRHGDRTPIEGYPKDPWRNESLWPVKFGQLTNAGKYHHYKFGQLLRKRYMSLISPYFDPTEVYVRSSNVDRTLMSAEINLAGLYPPVNKSVWNPDLAWQPVPVHTVPKKDDEILAMEKPCPKYDVELKRVKNDPAFINQLSQYKTLMDYLSLYSGLKIEDYYGIQSMYSVLKIEEENGFKLPGWTRAVYPQKMITPAGYSFRVNTLTELLARLKIGPFMKELLQNMLKVKYSDNSKFLSHIFKYDEADAEPPIKLHIYSAHDLNVGSVLNALGLYDGKCPVFTSAVLFELHYDPPTNGHFVKIFYRNTTNNKKPYRLSIPKCGMHCTLDQFVENYNSLIPVNWKEECRIKTFQITDHPQAYYLSVFLAVLILLCMLLLSRSRYYEHVYITHEGDSDYSTVSDASELKDSISV